MWFAMQGYHPLASTYNHCYEGFLKLLIEHLGTDVDPREPAAVAGVTVVPADGIFQASDLRKSREVKEPQRSAPFPKHRLPSSGTSSTLQGAEGQTGIPTREEIFPRNRTISLLQLLSQNKGLQGARNSFCSDSWSTEEIPQLDGELWLLSRAKKFLRDITQVYLISYKVGNISREWII